jgi:hypothetical protein
MMIYAFIISAIVLFIGVLLMGMRIFFTKDKSFPNIHIGGNVGLKNKGIGCATSQDRDAQAAKPKSLNNKDIISELTNKF